MNLKILHIIIILCAAVSACGGRPVIVPDQADKYEMMDCIDPSPDLVRVAGESDGKSPGGYKVKLTGNVEVNETGDVYIVVNPESKSRRTYLVTGKLKEQVASFKGEAVRVVCCFLEAGEWSGTVRVYAVSR